MNLVDIADHHGYAEHRADQLSPTSGQGGDLEGG